MVQILSAEAVVSMWKILSVNVPSTDATLCGVNATF